MQVRQAIEDAHGGKFPFIFFSLYWLQIANFSGWNPHKLSAHLLHSAPHETVARRVQAIAHDIRIVRPILDHAPCPH